LQGHRDQLPLAATEIEVGHPQPLGDTLPTDVLRLAALGAAPGTNDVLDRALLADAALRGQFERPDPIDEFHPPTEDDPWSRAVVRLGDTRLEIARGQPRPIVERLVRPPVAVRIAAIREAARLSSGKFAPLAVAYRREGEDWTLAGYVPIRGWSQPGRHGGGRPFDYHPVWDVTLRLCHWSWVAAIVVLTISGYFLAEPRWVPVGYTGQPTGFFIGAVRQVHYIAGVVLILTLLVRAWNLTTSRIQYDRWKSLIPFRSRRDIYNGWKTARAYAFVKSEEAPIYFGHNPLQQLTYTSVYVILVIQIATGLALWGLYSPEGWLFGLFGWINEWLGTAQVRLLHYMIMWGLIVFIPAHVYLSVRADSVERMGAISSMVSGGRWVRRGAIFEDWPRDPEERRALRRAARAAAAEAAEAAGQLPRDRDQQAAPPGGTSPQPAAAGPGAPPAAAAEDRGGQPPAAREPDEASR
jgi:Ni/Fe-hydrogenase b-type cytochrome subunit